jgi:hypothetical protein
VGPKKAFHIVNRETETGSKIKIALGLHGRELAVTKKAKAMEALLL